MIQIKRRGELIKVVEHFGLPKVAVEVGVAEGRFSRELLDSGFEVLYLVDIWESMPFIEGCASFDDEWHEANYRKVMYEFEFDKRVGIFKGFSHKMAQYLRDGSVGLVYIDGDHSYQGCKSDIKTWWPKLCDGGIMAFHDFANPDYGVSRAVIEHTQNEKLVNIIQEDGDIANIGAWIRK